MEVVPKLKSQLKVARCTRIETQAVFGVTEKLSSIRTILKVQSRLHAATTQLILPIKSATEKLQTVIKSHVIRTLTVTLNHAITVQKNTLHSAWLRLIP